MKQFILLLSLLCVCVTGTRVYAQLAPKHFTGIQATNIYDGASRVYFSGERNTISYIRLNESHQVSLAQSKSWLRDVLKARPEDDFTEYNVFNDNSGYTHKRFRQYYKGVPVEYGVYYIHSRDGRIKSANGEWYSGISVSTTPHISAGEAYAAACEFINAQLWWHEMEEADNNRLMVLPVGGTYKLAYKCDIYAKEPWTRDWVYVDAHDGSVIKKETRIHSTNVPGTAVTAYSGIKPIVSDSFQNNLFRLRDYSRGPGIETFNGNLNVDFTHDDNDWDYNGGFDMYALDAHFGSEATYDYYFNNYGWSSVDGIGVQKIKSQVHDGQGVNAFWDGTSANYLDGSASQGITPLTSIDVVGHELTHGVTENSSGLIYSCQSGGINEGMSDIFGVTIRFLNIENGTWLVGDQFNSTFRNMANPNEFSMPDCIEGLYWSNCLEVHSGSAIANFWYYLLTEGGTGVNDVGNTYLVEAIGLEKAGAIAFRSNSVYLTPNSNYAEFRDLAIEAAKDLYGDCSNEVLQTTNAWYAVNAGGPSEDYVISVFSADQTSFCSTPATVNFTNASINGTSYLWNFGDGNTSTDFSPSHQYTQAGSYTVSLTTTGNAVCGGSQDVLSYSNYITVADFGQPVAASCSPESVQGGPKFGVFGFRLGGIDNPSSSAQTEGYEDFSCSDFTSLNTDVVYPFEIDLGTFGNDVRMWIDYNNNGSFEAEELIYSADNVSGTVGSTFTVAPNAVTGAALRLRISDDYTNNTITDACYSPQKGQVEDYGVYITPAVVCPVPTNLSTSLITSSSALLDWDYSSTPDDFRVQYRETGTPQWIGKNVAGNQTSTTLTELLPATKYSWRVRARCDDENKSAWTSKVVFKTLPLKKGIIAEEAIGVKLYPNPATKSVSLEFKSLENQELIIRILDVTGKEMKAWQISSGGVNPIELNVAGLNSGFYSVEVVSGTLRTVQQLVIQH